MASSETISATHPHLRSYIHLYRVSCQEICGVFDHLVRAMCPYVTFVLISCASNRQILPSGEIHHLSSIIVYLIM
jgi:hypothetical protein